MNTMKGFYASIFPLSQLQGSYLEALSEITRINHKQANALKSERGWQEWGEQNQGTATGNL